MEQKTSLEEKEIRGINFKLIRVFTIGTASVVFSVLYSYFSLNEKMNKIQLLKVENDRYLDLRIKTIELNVSSVQIQLDNLRTEVIRNSKNIQDRTNL